MSDPVLVERDAPILVVTLDRPKANAIDAATSQALGRVFADFRDDDELMVAVITGGGEKFFSAGWDLKAAAAGEPADADFGPGGFAGLTELWDLNKPVIAAINGIAVGGGLELALACDLILAAEHAEFWFPETFHGIMADAGGVQRLPRRVPHHIAMELLLTGRRMGAEEAARHGLVNEVVPADRLLDRSQALAHHIAGGAPLAIMALKEAVRAMENLTVRESFELLKSKSLPLYRQMFSSTDAEEGPKAFAEKRSADFKGQ